MTTSCADLERRVDELWGRGQWDWVIGRTIRQDGDVNNMDDHIWFFYCGEYEGEDFPKPSWGHKGYGETITDVLTQMIEIGEARNND